jgi:hypothetical protein
MGVGIIVLSVMGILKRSTFQLRLEWKRGTSVTSTRYQYWTVSPKSLMHFDIQI